VGLTLPAALVFGTVGPWARAAVGSVAAVLALALLLRRRQRSAPPAVLVGLWFVALCAVLMGFVAFLPAGPGLREMLQPGYSELLAQLAVHGDFQVRPLALRPREALFSTVYGIHMALVTAAVAVSVTAPRRAVRVASVVVGAGIAVLGLHLAQVSTGAASIGWVTGVGAGRPFFGSFVNPNHGGMLCAAAAPLAAAVALVRPRVRWVFAAAAVALVAGAFLSGSRGATAACGLGLLVLGLVDGRRWLVKLAWASLALLLAGVALLGPDVLFEVYTRVVDPSMRGGDLYSNRPQVWQDASVLVWKAPWFGVGGDGFLDAYKVVKISPRFALASQAHNDPFQVVVEHGLFAGALWACCALFVVGSALRASRHLEPASRTLLAGHLAMVLSLFGFGLFDFPMRIGVLLFVGAIGVGVCLGLGHRCVPAAGARIRGVASGTVVGLALASCAFLGVAALADRSAFGDEAASRQAGVAAIADGDLDGAEAHLATALRQRPLNPPALLQLARVARSRGNEALAVDLLELAAEVYPTYPFTWLSLARVERARGDREAALDAYRRLITLNHPDSEPTPWLDEAFSYAGDFEHLIGYLLFDRADRYCPAAKWLERAGDRRGAELLYRFGAEKSAACAAALGWRLVSWGRPKEALAWTASLTSSCLTERTRSHALLSLGRHEEGLAAAERGLEQCGSDDRSARLGLARARLLVGDMRAMGMLERLLADEDEPTVRRLLFRGYRDTGRSDLAAEQVVHLSKQGLATGEELEWLRRFASGGR